MNSKEIENLVYQDFKNEFELFFAEYTKYNSHTNISAIKNKEDVFQKHFIDSLSILSKEDELGLREPKVKVLDIGTGGGFPAIPLAICKKNLEILALDSVGKKIKFVDHMIQKINLSNLKTIKARAEELAHNVDYRESFTIVTSRAVAKLKILIEISAAFLKPGGHMVAYKKLDIAEELSEIEAIKKTMGLILVSCTEYAPDRQLIILKKTESSAKNYPRKTSLL